MAACGADPNFAASFFKFSVEEQSLLGIFNHPSQAFLEVDASHCTTRKHCPPVGLDRGEPQVLALQSIVDCSGVLRSLPLQLPRKSCILRHQSCSTGPKGLLPLSAGRISGIFHSRLSQWLDPYFFKQQSSQFVLAVPYPKPICGIDHPDQGICFLEVVTPI